MCNKVVLARRGTPGAVELFLARSQFTAKVSTKSRLANADDDDSVTASQGPRGGTWPGCAGW